MTQLTCSSVETLKVSLIYRMFAGEMQSLEFRVRATNFRHTDFRLKFAALTNRKLFVFNSVSCAY